MSENPVMPPSGIGMEVLAALRGRRSVRAFRPDPVDRAIVEEILAVASRAPSGSNIQPWKVWVVAGEARDRLSTRLLAAHEADEPGEEEYEYYPRTWEEPFVARRRALGKGLYGLLGLNRADAEGMKRQWGRNYAFFGAPVGMFITIDRRMETGGWYDLGTFLMGILIAARGFGLEACPQQSFTKYHRLIRKELGIPEGEVIASGLALGFEDHAAPENRLVTEREPVSGFATFHWS